MSKQAFVLCNVFLALALLMGLTSPLASRTVQGQENPSVLTEEHAPDVAVDWMMRTYETVRNEKIGPTQGARVYGYMGIALWEAVVPGMPSNFSVGGQLQGLPVLPFHDTALEYDWPTVANASMSTVLTGLFPDPLDATTQPNIDSLRAQWLEQRTEATSAEVVERSTAYGDEIGGILLEWISTDNYGPTRKMEYIMPEGEAWMWVPTQQLMIPYEPFWGQIRPLGMEYAEVCQLDMDVPYSTDPNSTFYKQAQEVLRISDTLTEEQRNTALFWVDTPIVTGTPGGHWVMIEIQLVEQLDLPLSRTAEMFMLTNAALMDAFISAWSTKYVYNLLRPVTYIQANLRRNWEPFIQTPPFPEYPSGHSVVSGAAAEVLTTMFGAQAFTDRTPIINGHENMQRSFLSFEQAAQEAAISRLYGGIHYRSAIENGLRQGQCVGQQVLNRIRLRSVPQGE